MRVTKRLAAIALLASEACAPMPNTAGAVQCGEGSVCPPSFECRFGRCCPANAPLSQCPTEAHVPRREDGTLACDDEGRCPLAHGYECRQGRYCCPRDANPASGPCARGALGMPCNGMTMCVSPRGASADGGAIAGTCRTTVSVLNLPNGYCTANCSPMELDSCGALGICIGLSAFGFMFDSLCVARCRLPEGQEFGPCRSEPTGQTPSPYVCLPLAPGDPLNREGYCFPDCTLVSSLCRDQACNPQTHRCEPRCSATSCPAGRVCDSSSGACIVPSCRDGAGCSTGDVCQPSTGRCVRDCRAEPRTCGLLQRCDTSSGLCVSR